MDHVKSKHHTVKWINKYLREIEHICWRLNLPQKICDDADKIRSKARDFNYWKFSNTTVGLAAVYLACKKNKLNKSIDNILSVLYDTKKNNLSNEMEKHWSSRIGEAKQFIEKLREEGIIDKDDNILKIEKEPEFVNAKETSKIKNPVNNYSEEIKYYCKTNNVPFKIFDDAENIRLRVEKSNYWKFNAATVGLAIVYLACKKNNLTITLDQLNESAVPIVFKSIPKEIMEKNLNLVKAGAKQFLEKMREEGIIDKDDNLVDPTDSSKTDKWGAGK